MPPNSALLVEAFRLPAQALVDQRIAKKLLVEQGAPTAADKRLINDTVEELWWHAALKPVTVGVPAFVAPPGAVADTSRAEGTNAAQDVIELALLSTKLRPTTRDTQAQRLLQLIHRAIPYPVLLVAQLPGGVVLSLAQKRASLGEAGKWVLGDAAQTHAFDPGAPAVVESQFLTSLALDQLPRSALTDLAALYQAYADRITALAVAHVTGVFSPAGSGAMSEAQRAALAQRHQLAQQLAQARGAAAKARQMNQRVNLNVQIQRLQAELQANACALRGERS